MKRQRSEEYGTKSMAVELSVSEVRHMISREVQCAIEQSDKMLKALMERIQEVDGEPRYDSRIKKLEAHVKKVKRRGDAVFVFLRKHGNLDLLQNSRKSLSPNSATPTGSQNLTSSGETINLITLSSANGESSRESSVSTFTGIDLCEGGAGRKPKEGFWQSLRSKKEIVDLTDEAEVCRQNGTPRTDSALTAQSSSSQGRAESRASRSGEVEGLCSDLSGISRPPELEAQVVLQSRLPPFPDTPFPNQLPAMAAAQSVPQKPVVKMVRIANPRGLALLWNVEEEDPHAAAMDCYYIYVAQQHADGSFSKWKSMGVFKAGPLPMACSVQVRSGGKTLCFIIIGKDVYGRYGPYSDVYTVWAGQT